MFLWSADDMSSGRDAHDMSSGRGADNMSSGRGVDNTSSRRGADNTFSTIEHIKTTRDDVWMTLVLSVRKEDIKMTCTYTDNSSRDDMYITYAFLNSIQMTSTMCMCVDNVRKLSCG